MEPLQRTFLNRTIAWLAFLIPLAILPAPAEEPSRQASGVKVGEITDTTAIVWVRLTASPSRNRDGEVIKGHVRGKTPRPSPPDTTKLEGACPGAPGQVRVRYSIREDLSDAHETPWRDVTEQGDYAHQFLLQELRPATIYYYASETAGPGGKPQHAALRGRFQTAPKPDADAAVTFCAITCQMYCDLDHSEGFNIYPAIMRLSPQFVAVMGDDVYYDSEEPKALNASLARYHWQRMYSLPRHVELLRNMASYWEKDDHDTLSDDSWPGKKMGDLTFAEGQQIFRQQVPLGKEAYRTYRWGRSLQVWLTEGRDFRSPNIFPDGPDKTMWGTEQKEWFKRTVLQSDARWKVLLSPTPLVGPDRENKADNHSNRVFQHEGDELRAWFQEHVPNNFFVVCGDRHWQYHSTHPKTGLNEFSVGAASDVHASGSPGYDPEYHRFHRVKGGFLSVHVTGDKITFRHHDVQGSVVYEWSAGS